ncbi:tail fiber protein [Vibrio phage vB_ValC_WD615]|nr:tail fiber protein [Vibrio phage vB_ValC_WD615]
MSSRADMIGSGPSSGHYQAGPTPTEEKSMPTYINDELLALGGIVNGILEGGAFPPQGKMPVRWREGMMMYFTEPLDDVYNVGQYKGQKIITSAGVWLYRRERWWKIIDDPSSVIGAVFAYRLTADGTPPSTPPPSSYPPSGWEDTAPVKNSKSEWIWISMAAAYDENTDTYTWNQPTPFSAGVEDGIDGQDGSDGADGVRGTITVNKETSGSVWNDTEAYNAILNDPRSGGVVLNLDMVNLYNDSEEFSEQRFYSNGVWESFELFVDGNAIVTGTLIGDKIKSDTKIIIGGNYGQDVVIIDANDNDNRIWVGSSESTSAKFKVSPDGTLSATNANISGEINATSGVMNNITIEENCNVKGTIYAENIVGGITSGIVKNNPSSYVGFTGINTWATIADIVDVNTTTPYERNLRVSVTSGYEYIKIDIRSDETFDNTAARFRLINNTTGNVVWEYSYTWNASLSRTTLANIPSIDAIIPANEPAGTYQLQVSSNRYIDYIRYMQVSSGTSWSNITSSVACYLFRNSGELS